jgi:hypothetical protein
MKRITNIFCLAMVCAAIACNDASTNSESIGSKSDTGTTANNAAVVDETPMLKDTAAIMQAWMAHAKPGEMHAEMAKDNGVWIGEITHWMTADAPPSKSTGTATNKMIMDGRVQQSTFKGDMGGYPFEGLSTLAYDNTKKTFTNTWIDNMGTGMMVMEGKYDPATKITNFTGTCADPRTGKECKVRQTFRKVDDNTQHMEMFMTYPGGKEYKSMEITYKRKK